MKLTYVSLTGADDAVNIKDLEQLSSEYPLFECAILMFPQSEGKARNPLKSWREEFYQSTVKNRALHLCGTAINQFAQEEDSLMEEISNFQRVQINLLPKYASHELVEKLANVASKLKNIEFITQHNEFNTEYYGHWSEVSNHSYLYDASLGKGIAPKSWQGPIPGKHTGYAGSISPDNIHENIKKISLVTGNIPVWMDMESGIRTNNQFDKQKAKYILDVTKDF